MLLSLQLIKRCQELANYQAIKRHTFCALPHRSQLLCIAAFPKEEFLQSQTRGMPYEREQQQTKKEGEEEGLLLSRCSAQD
jgi:hypothetical protein